MTAERSGEVLRPISRSSPREADLSEGESNTASEQAHILPTSAREMLIPADASAFTSVYRLVDASYTKLLNESFVDIRSGRIYLSSCHKFGLFELLEFWITKKSGPSPLLEPYKNSMALLF